MRTLRLLWLTVLVVASVGLSGCKQGLGDRCALDSDCESGLRCSTGMNKVCENPNQVVPDASTDLRDARVIPDARFIPDAGPPPRPDAAEVPDGPIDEDAPTADAPLAVDGGTPDSP